MKVQIPTVLAGPQVRRAEQERLFFWLATSVTLDSPMVELYKEGELDDKLPTTSRVHSLIHMGTFLYIYLLEVIPEPGFPLPNDELIGYDILQSPPDGGDPQGLAAIMDMERIAPIGHEVPTFILQTPGDETLGALYGSCRKLHGPGLDMMVAAGKELLDTYDNPASRPTTLFLGGDQIYADDVSPDLIGRIQKLGKLLLGRKEYIHFENGPIIEIDAIPKHKRGKLLNKGAHFTSSHGDHHLLGIGEYAATYLLAWSQDLWTMKLPGEKGTPRYKGDLATGLFGSQATQFVLANMVTYMIFDDHEITDDWNVTENWAKKVEGTKQGRQVLANGLGAFYAFQGLGNNPDDFPEDFPELVGGYARNFYSHHSFFKRILAFDKWSYLAPTSPPALVLNTRTEREAPKLTFWGNERRRSHSGFKFFGDKEKRRLLSLLDQSIDGGGRPLIVIAPSPILDLKIKEFAQKITLIDPKHLDAESFAVNPKSIIDLIDILLPFRPMPLIVLSGDVHYGFETTATIHRQGKDMPMLQLCSSSLKNFPEGRLGEAMHKANKIYKRFGEHDESELVPVHFMENKKAKHIFAVEMTVERGEELRSASMPPNFSMISRFEVPKALMKKDEMAPFLVRNNLGQFWIDGQTIQHRFHFDSPRGMYDTTSISKWSAGSWPIKPRRK